MSTKQLVADSLINEMLQKRLDAVKANLLDAIKYQQVAYERAKSETFSKMLGESDSGYALVSHFKYQATIGTTLKEMERSYLYYFGIPWDFVPEKEEEDKVTEEPKAKRGRPRKNAI